VGSTDRSRAQLAEGKAKTQLGCLHALGNLRWQEIAARLKYSSLAEKLISLSVKSGLAQFDLNDDPGFEKIVVSVMPDGCSMTRWMLELKIAQDYFLPDFLAAQ
jgi:hypothetical protein